MCRRGAVVDIAAKKPGRGWRGSISVTDATISSAPANAELGGPMHSDTAEVLG